MTENHLMLSADAPVLERAEVSLASGKLYPNSGVALVRYGDDHYFIQPDGYSYKEPVHKLSSAEFERLHMHNLHAEQNRMLSSAEIGEPPFAELLSLLQSERQSIICHELVDTLLDPWEWYSADTHQCAATELEEMLQAHSDLRTCAAKRLGSFIPPEEYIFDMKDYDANAFPLLSVLLYEAHTRWEQTVQIQGVQRLTRGMIQRNHDSTTELSSENLLERATEARNTLQACLQDLQTSDIDGGKKWKEEFLEKKKLADAKGFIVLQSKDGGPASQRSRYADAEARVPGVLQRFDDVIRLHEEAKALLAKVEQRLGDIAATEFLS